MSRLKSRVAKTTAVLGLALTTVLCGIGGPNRTGEITEARFCTHAEIHSSSATPSTLDEVGGAVARLSLAYAYLDPSQRDTVAGLIETAQGSNTLGSVESPQNPEAFVCDDMNGGYLLIGRGYTLLEMAGLTNDMFTGNHPTQTANG